MHNAVRLNPVAAILATLRESLPSAELRSLVSPVAGSDCSKKNCAEALEISSSSRSSFSASGRVGGALEACAGAGVVGSANRRALSTAGSRRSAPPRPAAACSKNWRRPCAYGPGREFWRRAMSRIFYRSAEGRLPAARAAELDERHGEAFAIFSRLATSHPGSYTVNLVRAKNTWLLSRCCRRA